MPASLRPAQPALDEPPAESAPGVPTLQSPRVTLRGLHTGDAETLCALLTTAAVGQFILPPPDSVERFERFIQWTQHQHEGGRQICFGIVPAGHDTAVGLVQVRREFPEDPTAEWGIALSERFWGTGLFLASADLLLTFVFESLRIHRLEALTMVDNARANGAMQKLGAVQEGRLRQGFHRNGEHFDQYLWSILADEWRTAPPQRAAS
jgi:RimJ/RimL family protein N-acetyltransferase